jgi:hypothetical protein
MPKPSSVARGLEIVMRHNYFSFGDTHWLQTTGTAMGTPPGCVYVTLYFGIGELEILPLFSDSLSFYCRYMDNCFGLWTTHPDPAIDDANWHALQASMDSYGKLEWQFTPCCPRAQFLDLDLTITPAGIQTKIYEKRMNLSLYLPPHSAHPPGVLRGLIIGMVKRIFHLTTFNSNKKIAVHRFYRRLLARGYQPAALMPIFDDAFLAASCAALPNPRDAFFEKHIFLHLPYNPQDPPSKVS